MSGKHIRFKDSDQESEVDNIENIDEETDIEETNVAWNKNESVSESEEEVFGVHSDTDESSDIALSDVEEKVDDDLPDVRAWGKDKRKYYSTDYVDPDFGGYQGKDATLAELEEEEAKNLQNQLIQQLDDADFILDGVSKKPEKEEKKIEEIITTDISNLSKRQKIQLLEKEAPEFFGLINDFKAKVNFLQKYIRPVLDMFKENKIPESKAVEFVETFYHLILNYFVNIAMYLLLKSQKVVIQIHPIIKRLYQYRQLLSQMDVIFNEMIKPQVEVLIEEYADSNSDTLKEKINALEHLKPKHETTKRKADFEKEFGKADKKKKVKIDDNLKKVEKEFVEDDLSNSTDLDTSTVNEIKDIDNHEEKSESKVENETNRRSITYQMAKNKGLTPHRKKELRNPRVKHRLKYRKAKIRRKGAVREVRKELTRYAGEISGIKASVTKSIKIKT